MKKRKAEYEKFEKKKKMIIPLMVLINKGDKKEIMKEIFNKKNFFK